MADKTRDYHFSDAELCILVSNMVVKMQRDVSEFILRGVDALTTTAYKDLGDAYEIFPSDDEYLGLVMIEVEAKDALRISIYDEIQLVSGFVEQEWGLDSGEYKRLGIKGLDKTNDGDYLKAARKVARIATEYLTTLTAIGLVQSMIDSLVADAESFEQKINSVDDANSVRENKTLERAQNGNELFSYAKKYSKIGKLIWENVNIVKFEEYQIYQTVHSGLSKPQNLTAVVNASDPNRVDIDFDAVAGATSYKLYFNEALIGYPPGSYTFISVDSVNHFDTPLISGKRNYWKVRAYSDSKKSDYSDEVYLDG